MKSLREKVSGRFSLFPPINVGLSKKKKQTKTKNPNKHLPPPKQGILSWRKCTFSWAFFLSVGKYCHPTLLCFSVVAIFALPEPSSFPPLLPSAKFHHHHFPSRFLSQFPAHTVVHEYFRNSRGRRRSLQTHTRFITLRATGCRLGFDLILKHPDL